VVNRIDNIIDDNSANSDPLYVVIDLKTWLNLSPNFSRIFVSSFITASSVKDIDMLLSQGVMASKIEEIIREEGFKGSSSTIRHYASE